MKKLLTLLTIMVLLTGIACAEDLQVQFIVGEDLPQMALDLDDMQLGQTYEIDGYARITPVSFEFMEKFIQYDAGAPGDNTSHGMDSSKVRHSPGAYNGYYKHLNWMRSGVNADFAWFLMDITNTQKTAVNFIQEATVKVVFDEEYEYAGWVRQFNYDYDLNGEYHDGVDQGDFIRAALDPVDEESIDMMYTGHYVFGCTLPTAVVEGTEPLRMVIDLGGNELTYNIR